MSQICPVNGTKNWTFNLCSITKLSHIYPCFVTNICHYFNLLDEICGKIHAVT